LRARCESGPYAAAFRLPAHAKKAHVLFVQFLISAMMTSSSFAGIGKVDRYGPFIHSGLDRPNHELNAFSAAEASASLAFAATELSHRGRSRFWRLSYYDSCIVWTGYNWVNATRPWGIKS